MPPLQGTQVQSLVGELRSYKPCGMAKKKKKKNTSTYCVSALGINQTPFHPTPNPHQLAAIPA